MSAAGMSLKSTPDAELRTLCEIPKGGWKENHTEKAKVWLAACWEARRRDTENYISEFASKGSAQKWFSQWNPKSKKGKKMAEALEEALAVAEKYYPPIAERGLSIPEDMGLLQSHGRGESEGIRAKKSVREDCVLLQICCTTGPINHDPSDNTVEFEPGSQSHILMLCYRKLPSMEDLEADICAYPMVTSSSNYRIKRSDSKRLTMENLTYRSEGFTSANLRKDGVPVHAPWSSLTPRKQKKLMSLDEAHLNLKL